VSVLVIEPDAVNGRAVVERLIAEGDDVGVLVGDSMRAQEWRALGAHVAAGSVDDADLIERAAQQARSIVLFDAPQETVSAVVQAARLVGRPLPRIIYCTTRRDSRARELLGSSGLDYVSIIVPVARRGLRRRKKQEVEPESVGEAVSAADDIAGEMKLEVDLQGREGRAALGLS
jgi:hypothetical protein